MLDALCLAPLVLVLGIGIRGAAPVWSGQSFPKDVHVPDIAAMQSLLGAGSSAVFSTLMFVAAFVLFVGTRRAYTRRGARLASVAVMGVSCSVFMLFALLSYADHGVLQPRQDSLSGRDKWVAYSQVQRSDAALDQLSPALREYVDVQIALHAAPSREHAAIAITRIKPLLQRMTTDAAFAAAVSPSWVVPMQQQVARVDPTVPPPRVAASRRAMSHLLKGSGTLLLVLAPLLVLASAALGTLCLAINARIARVSWWLDNNPGLIQRMDALQATTADPTLR